MAMKKYIVFLFTIVFVVTILPCLGNAENTIEQMIALDDEKTLQNYMTSMDICRKALLSNPNDFELNWRYAKACRWYGGLSKLYGESGWEDACAAYGSEGMESARKAIALKPDQPHGYYYYGLNAGVYADGVSVFTAIAEGLKDKIQGSFEKVYQIDKTYENAGSILCLARFWQVLPWPLTDRKKSLAYYREYQKTAFFGTPYPDGPIYLAELLIDLGGNPNMAEAKMLLSKVNPDRKYYKDWVDKLMARLDAFTPNNKY